jgi:hypothetical protein
LLGSNPAQLAKNCLLFHCTAAANAAPQAVASLSVSSIWHGVVTLLQFEELHMQ